MRLLNYAQLKEKMGDGFYVRDHLRRLCNAGKFPKPVPISDRRIAWVEAEVDAWLQSRAALRDGGADGRPNAA
jgi:predicted DNA-binding transcriptional regulator AlpA